MNPTRTLHHLAAGLSLAAALSLGGCAAPQRPAAEAAAPPPFRDPALTMQAARALLVTGRSSTDEALARLGPGTVVRFPSGYQVWVYRAQPPRRGDPASESAELVLLFSPAGVLARARVRLPYDSPL